MAVYDRWHKSRPKPDEAQCREHKQVPTADHGIGDRWQVRWRDEDGKQLKRNFDRKTGTHDVWTAGGVERNLRLHAYPAIGHRTLRELAQRPSLIQSWIAGIKLAPGSARLVITQVSAIFVAAIDDGLIARNPLNAKSVTRPKRPDNKAQPWTRDQVSAMSGELAPEYTVLPWLGAGAGPRQGEMFGLAVDDIDFLRRVIHIRRQVRLAGNVLCFAPVKNG